jgi:hypothetical protein
VTITCAHGVDWPVGGVLDVFENAAQFVYVPAVFAVAVIVITLLCDGLRTAPVWQFTVSPLVVHVQPEPVPDGLVKPDGTVSWTVVGIG